MAKTHPIIDADLKSWIDKQPLFFLASSPLQADGHINVSPRGLESLKIIGDLEVLTLDLTGSGNETAAHLAENGRLTIMFCAFEGDPKIVRLYGRAEVITTRHPEWQHFRAFFPADIPGVRQLFHLNVQRVQTSCGFGVPLMTYVGQRDLLRDWAQRKGPNGLEEYRQLNNQLSIDGLVPPDTNG